MLTTIEILLIIPIPLVILYLRGKWPIKMMVICLIAIPILWYLTYAPIHELSHILGTYLAGGKVVDVKLIPRFWMGEFAGAWITPVGLSQPWQNLVMSSAPYVLDLASMITGAVVLRRRMFKNAFWAGFLFMFLCLRPTFDLACEAIGFYNGFMGDLFHIQQIVGNGVLSSFLLLSLGLSVLMIYAILKRYPGYSERLTANA
jgi:hypothetical protein